MPWRVIAWDRFRKLYGRPILTGDGFESGDVGEDVLAALCAYDWPGNVRELENALERAAVVASNPEISVADLPEGVRDTDARSLVADHLPSNPSMEVIERVYIQWVLTAEGGNKSKAAEVLGIDPSTLYRKLNRYGIEV